MEPIITLCDGSDFDFRSPLVQRYDIVVIAHALSKICRFTGHFGTTEIYSVAQHSVLTSYLLQGPDKLDGLLHDAHEAFVGDMSAPLKLLCPDYCRIEREVEIACRRSFGLADDKSVAVRDADQRMFWSEYNSGFPLTRRDPARAVTSTPLWSPREAKDRFLRRYEELTAA